MKKIKIFLTNGIMVKYSWKFKRTLLNLLWGLTNVIVLAYISTLIIGTGWEYIWLAFVAMYCTISWILASILFDFLIGE